MRERFLSETAHVQHYTADSRYRKHQPIPNTTDTTADSILLLLPHSADFRVVRCGAAVADNKGRRAGLVHRTGAAK